MTFEEWYNDTYTDWWKDHKKELAKAWSDLVKSGASPDVVASSFSVVVDAIRDQYGD